jgi:hypothetical protein
VVNVGGFAKGSEVKDSREGFPLSFRFA